ncbi:hypothetical protein QT928_022000, partial [Xanthomonas campestris pv. campestris]
MSPSLFLGWGDDYFVVLWIHGRAVRMGRRQGVGHVITVRSVACILALALWSCAFSVNAAMCMESADACDQGQAFLAARMLADQRGVDLCKLVGGSNSLYKGPDVLADSAGIYNAQVTCSVGGPAGAGSTFYSKTCAQRPPLIGASPSDGSGFSCDDGCFYNFTIGASGGTGMYPSGATCSAGDAPPSTPGDDGDGDGDG